MDGCARCHDRYFVNICECFQGKTMPWKSSSMKALCEEFARTTSAHGFAHLDTSGSAAVRRFWGLTCFAAMAAVVAGLTGVAYRYLLYPTHVAMQLSTKQLPFPAVTICNQRPTDFYTVADIVYDEGGHMRWTMGNFSYTGRPCASRFEKDVVKYVNSYAVFSPSSNWARRMAHMENPYLNTTVGSTRTRYIPAWFKMLMFDLGQI